MRGQLAANATYTIPILFDRMPRPHLSWGIQYDDGSPPLGAAPTSSVCSYNGVDDYTDAMFYAGLLTIKFSFQCVALHETQKQLIRRWVILVVVILASDNNPL